MSSELTAILLAAHEQEPHSAEKLLPQLYEELRAVAARKLSLQPSGQTLQPTALVHEAFLRLTTDPARTWENRRHFFAAASEAMRHILVDRARRKASVRHGGELQRVDLEGLEVAGTATDESIIALNDALEQFEQVDPQASELVRLRFFGGFTFAQAAEILGISERTAKRDWSYARAWLFETLQRRGPSA